MTIERLNNLRGSEARDLLSQCCGSAVWVDEMMKRFPFDSAGQLFQTADEIWLNHCDEKDWLEAFTHHPKIGDLKSLQEKFASTKDLAAAEQANVQIAGANIIAAFARGNEDYEKKFSFIFIVCATGKTAVEMLQLLNSRLKNNYEEEIKIAMREQAKITNLRIQKLLS